MGGRPDHNAGAGDRAGKPQLGARNQPVRRLR